MNIYSEIIRKVGYDSYLKGRIYPYNYIKHLESILIDKKYKHVFQVKSERARNWYDVVIFNNGRQLYDLNCTCEQFNRFGTCKHVAAALIEYIDEIIGCEFVDELEVSKQILKQYINKNKIKNNIKQKLNLEIETDINDDGIIFKLFIGDKKLYTLSSESKLLDFMDALKNNHIYEFGKNFSYDPSIHYFDKNQSKILEFIFDYEKTNNYYYRTNPFSMTFREFESFLKIIEKIPLKIKEHGLINEIIYGMPTNYVLNEIDNNYKLNIENYDEFKFLGAGRYILYNHNLYILNNEDTKYINLLMKNKINSITFEKKDLKKFSNGLFKNIKNNLRIDETITEVSLPTKPEVKLYFDILLNKLICNVIFDYNTTEVNYFDKGKVLRDDEYELEIIKQIIEYGFVEQNKKLIIDNEDYIYDFVENTLPKLTDKYKVFTSKKIENTNIIKKTVSNSNFSIGKEGIMSYEFSVDGVPQNELNNIFAALKSKKRYYRLKNNNVISLENNEDLVNLNNLIEDLNLNNQEITSGNVEIPKYRAIHIDSLKQRKFHNIKTNNLFDQFIENFKKYHNIQIEFDEFDKKQLRDYQKEGVKWLTTIYKCDLGGILADEMGLGKSIQTISFIKQILKEKKDAKIIIVAPTSLIYNWQKEFEKFGSELKYVVVAENKIKRKQIFENKEKYNIFITTYGLIRNDNDEYENINFELCIIDEAQAIKNYQAGMTKEIKKIKAKCKIALTGTPVENNTTELWSIFDFIMPGYLNSIIKFREKYNIKDVDETALTSLKELSNQILPFMLRRKKSEVAKSLPDKIENNVYVELPQKQKMLYLKVLHDTKEEMDEIIATEGFQKSRMKILQLLMKLRQICIDPNVMYDNYDGERIKIEELLNIVKQNIENGHKILIFSSFKRILDNVKDLFIENSISSYMIDGSIKSKDRMDMVESFNKDSTNCFLITLKSGGTGLNLVGADVVIHLDIWWNPAVENQATDRAHRIGQTKNVNVIKIITRGTIEEKILELQEKKKILSNNLIEGKANAETLSSLTEDEIKKLLSYSED